MVSTYSANSGIEKPASGSQSGTWGDTVNTNMDIIDRVMAGVGSITLSGTTHTLTTSDGSLSDGHYRVLVLGGTPSGTNTITVSPNDQDKLYFVVNASGADVVFSQGSGANVTVANGKTKIIYCDGGGASAAVSDFTKDLNLAGTTEVVTLNIGGTAVTSTAAELNLLDGSSAGTIVNSKGVVYGSSGEVNATTLQIGGTSITSTAAELNLLDGSSAGTVANSKAVIYGSSGEVNATTLQIGGTSITATAAELNYVDGVTSAIQTQIDAKQATITGAASTIASSNLTVSRALESNGSGKVAASSVTSTELGYVSGVTSAIQTQIDAKQATVTGAATTITGSDLTASRALSSNSSGKVEASSVTSTELGYLSGVTSNVQTQFNNIVTTPAGVVSAYAGSSAPSGWLLCYGQAVSRTTYSALFSAISTTYGTGDGSTTFNLPDLRGRVVAGQDDMGGVSADRLTGQTGGVDGDTLGGSGGAETHTLTEAQLASHSHGAAKKFIGSDSGTSRNSLVDAQQDIDTTFQGYETSTGGADLLIQNTGSDSAHNNVQPTLILNYIIKT